MCHDTDFFKRGPPVKIVETSGNSGCKLIFFLFEKTGVSGAGGPPLDQPLQNEGAFNNSIFSQAVGMKISWSKLTNLV